MDQLILRFPKIFFPNKLSKNRKGVSLLPAYIPAKLLPEVFPSHLQGNPNSSGLQFEVAYWPAPAVGGAAQYNVNFLARKWRHFQTFSLGEDGQVTTPPQLPHPVLQPSTSTYHCWHRPGHNRVRSPHLHPPSWIFFMADHTGSLVSRVRGL